MSESPKSIQFHSPDASMRGAGDILRAARESQGLSLEHLAAVLKVSPAKLEALEQGRIDQLPDASFARALAQTMCRVLKIDATPVMAALPAARIASLASDKEPLNQPFKEARLGAHMFDRSGAGIDWSQVLKLKWLAPLALLLAAAFVYLLPDSFELSNWLPQGAPVSQSASAASAPEVTDPAFAPALAELTASAASASALAVDTATLASSAAASAPLAQGTASLPSSAASLPTPADLPAAAAPLDAGVVVLSVTTDSWVDVTDGEGVKRVSRIVRAGETLSMGGVAPWGLKIGNAGGVKVTLRGEPIELAAFTRNNVARLELK